MIMFYLDSKTARRTISWISALVLLALSLPATAADFYVSKSGSDANSGTQQEPFASISRGVDALSPGDTLFIGDGTYRERVVINQQASQAEPIVVKAINDGEVTIDGEGARKPLSITGSYITVEGLVCRNSNRSVVTVAGSHNTVRRVSAYRSRYGGNDHGFEVVGSNNLIVDTVAASVERHLYLAWSGTRGARGNVFRRAFGYGGQVAGTPKASTSAFNIYGASETIVENCIGWGGSTAKSLSIHSAWSGAPPDSYDKYESSNNKVLGGLFRGSGKWGITLGYGHRSYGSVIENNVIVDNASGGISLQPGTGGSDELLRNNTIAGNGGAAIRLYDNPQVVVENQLIYNNAAGFSGSDPASVTYSNSYGNASSPWPASRGEGCIEADPKLPDDSLPLYIPQDSPCKGTGKNGADMGANLYYRYENGVLTDEPLWPWPMAERIKDELGIDVMAEVGPLVGGFHASVQATPERGMAPSTVEFQAHVVGGEAPYSYQWDFGDGSAPSSEEAPSHVFTSGGTYRVTLQVSDANGEVAEAFVEVEVAEERRLQALRAESAPTLDGRIDPGEWHEAPVVEFSPNGSTSTNSAAFRAVWTDESLYVAMEVSDSDLELDSQQMAYQQDGVEFFVDPRLDRSRARLEDDLKWIVTAAGTVEFSDVDEGLWSVRDAGGDVDAAVATQADGYVVETRIAWSRLGIVASEGFAIGFEPTNNDDHPSAETTHHAWSGETPGMPADWGVLQLADSSGGSTSPDGGNGTDDVGMGGDVGDDASQDAVDGRSSQVNDAGGCGCRTTSPASPAGALGAAIALLGLLWARRRAATGLTCPRLLSVAARLFSGNGPR